jgi:signal transduction histidine kinase
MLALAGFAVAEPVDPRFPSDRPADLPEEWTRWPRARIRQLEAERDQLLKKISVLPQHDPKFQSNHLGYHSLFEDPGPDGSLPPHQLDITLLSSRLDSIALAPAFNPKESGAYAFPKRFKIEVQNPNTGEFETVVNWMDEDFPDPGPYPVFFSGINQITKQVRITVPKGVRESGVDYYALGEIYLFRQKSGSQMGDNMIVWPTTGIAASESFMMPPIWDTQYLRDGVGGFGFPLSDETVASEDLLIRPERGVPLSDKVQLTLDLGHVRDIGPIDFWPAAAPYLLSLPSFGFPEKISVELSADPDFSKAGVFGVKNASGNIHRGDLFSVKCEGYDARYVRVTLEGLREYKGKRILGLGEISVSHNEEVWSVDCKVAAQGIPDEYLDQLPRLVDGYSRQRRILPQGEWIKGLAQRRPLDRRLAVVERELALARETWRVLQLRISVLGSVTLCMALIFGRVFLKRQRRRVLNKLKLRITRDLHDEVGSSLGSISLTAEQLENMTSDAEMKEELGDLSLMAREACVSLREVVWVIDQSTIHLPDLIKKLVERAERVLHGVELSVEIPPDCPNMGVALAFKRYLIMFFKEAVHNCVRHAHATQAWVAFSTDDQRLQVSVRDNGCGFDPEEASDGCGVDNMKERAKEMGGRLEIVSQPGKGTSIVLSVPLANLSKEPDNAYTTSN